MLIAAFDQMITYAFEANLHENTWESSVVLYSGGPPSLGFIPLDMHVFGDQKVQQ